MRASNSVPWPEPQLEGWYPGDYGNARGAPLPSGPYYGHNVRYDQANAAVQPPIAIDQQSLRRPDSWPAPFNGAWPGPMAHLGRQFYPRLAGYAGAMSHGGTSLEGDRMLLKVPNINWWKKQSVSIRAVSQPLNATAGGVGVPSVFVPASAVNFRGQQYISY
jgi:hypothetical protein